MTRQIGGNAAVAVNRRPAREPRRLEILRDALTGLGDLLLAKGRRCGLCALGAVTDLDILKQEPRTFPPDDGLSLAYDIALWPPVIAVTRKSSRRTHRRFFLCRRRGTERSPTKRPSGARARVASSPAPSGGLLHVEGRPGGMPVLFFHGVGGGALVVECATLRTRDGIPPLRLGCARARQRAAHLGRRPCGLLRRRQRGPGVRV